MQPRHFSAVAVTLASIACGVLLGVQTGVAQDRVGARERIYTGAVAAIEMHYVEPLDKRCLPESPLVCGAEATIYRSIEGMLRTLDPHSSFFDPREFAQMRERQEGRYFGIGIQIVSVGGEVVVTSLFEGSPAYRAGIRRGDVIARVGNEEARGWTTQDVVDRVKGPKGTTVEIWIRRGGVPEPIRLEIERDQIRIPTVRTAFMIAPGTGYIRLQDFSETTNDELGEALDKLKAASMERLVLDLRGNPGGPLDQAIAVASRFLRRGEMVVYTRGRIQGSDDDYRVTDPGAFTAVPLIVLVNRSSASASEIVAGSMQDHDRGLIVGEATFGKALVQSVYPISNGAGLALTTGRYYTPSGRLIQRPFEGAFDDYLTYGERDQDPSRARSASDLKYSDGGRKVYGGGGIEPDYFVAGPLEGFNPTRFSRMLYSRQAFVGFAERFTKEGDKRPGAQSAAEYTVGPGWQVTPEMVEAFRKYLIAERVRMDEAAFKADEAFLRAMIHFEVDIDLFGAEEARRHLSSVDPQVQVALGHFGEAAKLLAARLAR
jgi:carboxyl-terminal processing protease